MQTGSFFVFMVVTYSSWALLSPAGAICVGMICSNYSEIDFLNLKTLSTGCGYAVGKARALRRRPIASHAGNPSTWLIIHAGTSRIKLNL